MLRSDLLPARLVAWFFSLCLALAATAPVSAADDFQTVIKRAVVEFDLGHWQEAHALFKQAHELNASARTWRGLGITSFELRHYVDAIAQLEAALADPRKPLTAEMRKEAEDILARARQFVSVYQLRIAPTEAEVLVDGKPAELRDGLIALDPGPHTVSVRAPGYEERRASLDAAAGTREELSIELSVMGSQEEGAPETRTEVASSGEPHAAPRAGIKAYPWTVGLAAGTIASGAVGLGLGLATKSKNDDFQSCVDAGKTNCADLSDKGEGLQLGTNVMFGVAGAALVGTVVAAIIEGRHAHADKPTAGLRVRFLGTQLMGQF